MNSQDFYDWKRHPVTEAVFSNLNARMNLLIEELVEQTAYSSHEAMAEKAGAVKAIRDFVNITYEGETE